MTQEEIKKEVELIKTNAAWRESCKFWYNNSKQAFGAAAYQAMFYEWYLESLEEKEANND